MLDCSLHKAPLKKGVTLYDKSNIADLAWNDYEEGELARNFLLPLIQEDVSSYISNVETQLFILALDTHLIPITVNEREYQNSYVASNYYGIERLAEAIHASKSKFKILKKPLIGALKAIFSFMQMNQMVMINNWLLTSAPPVAIKPHQINELLEFCQQKFPKHFIIWRNINTYDSKESVQHVRHMKARSFKMRDLWIYDPKRKEELSSKVHYHHRRDIKLISQEGYELIRGPDIKAADLPRLIDLYRKVYMDKYTSFSPLYTEDFLAQAIEKGHLQFLALRKNGVIDGVCGMFMTKRAMSCPFFGYETASTQSQLLYRMLTVLLIKESEERNCPLNDGSGSDLTKKIRGLKQYNEYVAVFDSHLSFPKRFVISSLSFVVNGVILPILKLFSKKEIK